MAATQDAQELFNSHDSAVAPLGLVVTEGARELGEKINAHLVSWATPDNNPRGTFLVENECPFFFRGQQRADSKHHPGRRFVFPGRCGKLQLYL